MSGDFKIADIVQARPFSPSGGEAGGGGFNLAQLWALTLRRWRVMAGSVLVVTGLAAVWLLQIAPIYTAATLVLIDPRKERVSMGGGGVAPEITLDASSIATEVALIQSFAIARRVAERLKLADHPRFGKAPPAPSLWEAIRGAVPAQAPRPAAAPGSEPPRADKGADKGGGGDLSPRLLGVIGQVQGGVAVRRVAATYFLEISFSHADPAVAAALANGIAEAYLVEQLEARYQAAKRAAGWLSERVAALRDQLGVSERALAEHRAKYNLVDPQAGTIAEQQAAEINTQLVAARGQTVEKKARFDQAQKILQGGAGIETVASVMDSPIIASLRQQDADLARGEADQLTRYGPEHPSIVKLRAERADIKRQIAREVARLVQTLKTDYEFALKKEESLEASRAELTGAGNRNDQAVIRLRELERDVQANRVLYDSLLSRFKEAEQQTSLNTAESRVISPALTPGAPSYPNKQRFLSMALVAGLAAGFGLAFLMEYVESGFATMEQVEQALLLPVLAMVPRLTERDRTIGGRVVAIPDYVALKPLSRFGESIRGARVGARMSNIDTPPRVILVTSSVPSEGKTTVALSLAYSAAAANERVLLMDCDLRHPSASRHFKLPDARGLTALLRAQAESENVYVRGPLPSLTILPAGTTTRHPPDVLGSERLRQLLGTLRQSYDAIYIDAPPVTPVLDSVVLAKLAVKVVFVVAWRRTPRDLVQRAVQAIGNPRQKAAGIVLNDVQLSVLSSYGRYDNYYHGKHQKYYAQ